MKRVLSIGAVVSLLVFSGFALAELEARPHLFFMGSLVDPDSGRGTDEQSNGWQVGLGIPLTERWYLEGIYFDNVLETGDNQGSDFYQRGGGADIQYGFGDRERFTPFILAGIGGVQNDVVPDFFDEDSFYFNVGVGAVGRLFNLKWLRYRAEARYFRDDYFDGLDDLRYSLGVEVALGAREKVKEVVVEKVVYRPAAPVQRPVDSDRDGVIDGYDDCPNTYAGARVDGRGCVIEAQTISINNVVFDTDSSELSLNAKNILSNALQFLQSQPNLHAEIAGHTDSVGAAEYNVSLSQRRADSVKLFFISNGISSSRLTSRGYGESSPIAVNSTADGREANRRVELRLIPR